MNENKLLSKKHKALCNGNKQQLVAVCVDLAELYAKEERYECCIKEYKIVAENYEKMGNMMDCGRANRMIGECYTHLMEYDLALKHQQIHLNIAKKQNDKLEEQRALATLGHTNLTNYLNTNHKDALHLAYKYFRKSLTVCESLKKISKHEHMDMQARLLANLGIVQEGLGNYKDGIRLAESSIEICKEHEIYVQLERNYNFLGTLYSKLKEYSKAIQHYNLAIEVAKRLKDKTPLVSTMLLKAHILLNLNDFKGAKAILRKAYNIKTPSKDDSETVTHHLKVVAALCKIEESLQKETEQRTLKGLYENIGDGLCELKQYEKAIEYYQKMLESARECGAEGNELSSCYVSLAQTYSDNGQYDLALEYFRKEYELQTNGNDANESLTTLYSIAETLESAGRDFAEIDRVYAEAIARCATTNDVGAEKRTLKRYRAFLIKFDKRAEADGVRERLDDIGYVSGETDSESVSEHTPQIGDGISIGSITDISEESDIDIIDEMRPRRKKRALPIKRNEKGETQLHGACIRGNLTLVRHLLDEGHTVNVRDNCGWLPLHEACNFGHMEIVRLLLQRGALVNDRGGIGCNGVTPLYDAASNGHLELIELLLDNGASPCAKTDDGDVALNVLRKWRATNADLDPDATRLYERIARRMAEAMAKSGIDDKRPCSSSDNELGNVRRVPVLDSSDDEATSNRSVSKRVDARAASSTDEYKRVMEDLRFRRGSSDGTKKRKKEKPRALIETNDWLDDDVGGSSKKRKTLDVFTTRSSTSGNLSRNRSFNSSRASNDTIPDDYLADVDLDETITPENVERYAASNRTKQQIQTSLFRAGFKSLSKRRSDPCSPNRTSGESKSKQTPKTDGSFYGGPSISNTSTVPVDVRINERLYRVPIPVQDVDRLTVKWLEEEAAKRYAKREGVRPTLELETTNGAVLEGSDYLSVLFPCGRLQAEEIHAKILGYHVVSLLERYTDTCTNLNEAVDVAIADALRGDHQQEINLRDGNLRKRLNPLLSALNRSNSGVQSIDFAGNFVTDNCADSLCNALSSLDNLRSLDLSLNRLTAETAKKLSMASQQNRLRHLIELNLSHNELGDESLPHLSVVTRYSNLTTLKLIDVGFTERVFDDRFDATTELCLDYVKRLEIGHNALNKNDIVRMVRWAKAKNLEHLNVGNNRVTEEGLLWEVIELFNDDDARPQLKEIDLSRCLVTDFELYEFFRLLNGSSPMDSINLSYNKKLTSASLTRVLENGNVLRSVTLVGCRDLMSSFPLEHPIELHPESELNRLILSVDTAKFAKECDRLASLFQRLHVISTRSHSIEIKRSSR